MQEFFALIFKKIPKNIKKKIRNKGICLEALFTLNRYALELCDTQE